MLCAAGGGIPFFVDEIEKMKIDGIQVYLLDKCIIAL